MDVKLIKTNKKSLSELPIVNGQIIVLEDEDVLYYDLEDRRHTVSGGAPSAGKSIGPSGPYDTIFYNSATGKGAHVEGCGNTASGEGSHAEGAVASSATSPVSIGTTASGVGSHSEGGNTHARGNYSHSEGRDTYTEGDASHAEGYYTRAIGEGSHAEGCGTTENRNAGGIGPTTYLPVKAVGRGSHAGGKGSEALGDYSFAHGVQAIARREGATVFGTYPDTSDSDVFVVGVGTSYNNKKNAFRIYKDGSVYVVSLESSKLQGDITGNIHGNLRADYSFSSLAAVSAIDEKILTHKSYSAMNGTTIVTDDADTFYVRAYDGIVHSRSTSISGADYAEYMYPWHDSNENDEDRTGYFVTVKDKLLYKANSDDAIVGVTSETYGVLGTPDALDEWSKKYKVDGLGRTLYDEDKPILSPDYDMELSESYSPRSERSEWSAVGMLGQIHVRDDGTCEPGKYCKCADGGIATSAEKQDFNTWLVLERTSENTIKILFK